MLSYYCHGGKAFYWANVALTFSKICLGLDINFSMRKLNHIGHNFVRGHLPATILKYKASNFTYNNILVSQSSLKDCCYLTGCHFVCANLPSIFLYIPLSFLATKEQGQDKMNLLMDRPKIYIKRQVPS